MANAKISQLPAVTSVAGTDLAVAVASGTTSQITIANLFTSPALTTPNLGTPSAGTLTNCTGLPVATGVSGLGSGVATFLATPSSANLAAAVTGETGSGALVFATSPTLVTPVLGTPASGTLTNCTGLPVATGVSGLGSGVATFLATPSSANLASAVTGETGSGALVFGTSPTITSPVLTLRVSTAAALGDIANAINTAGKAQGAVVYNSNDNLLYVANGALAADTWSPSGGGTDITPA